MKNDNLNHIINWFHRYTESFLGDEEIDYMIRIKQAHTARVASEMKILVNQLFLAEEERNTALAIAWLHDVGRFPQAAKYRRMFDYDSEDHALLSVAEIKRAGILNGLPSTTNDRILTAIENHNKFILNGKIEAVALKFCRLIRDADKLDIMNTIITLEKTGAPEEIDQVYLLLKEKEGYTPSAIEQIRQRKLVRLTDVNSRNDFRLLMLAWVFDINFPPTFKAIKERKYYASLRELLPQTNEIDEVITTVENCLEKYIVNEKGRLN